MHYSLLLTSLVASVGAVALGQQDVEERASAAKPAWSATIYQKAHCDDAFGSTVASGTVGQANKCEPAFEFDYVSVKVHAIPRCKVVFYGDYGCKQVAKANVPTNGTCYTFKQPKEHTVTLGVDCHA